MFNPLLRLVDAGIRCLNPHLKQYAFRRIARQLDVTSVTCSSALGTFEGDPRDGVVLAYLLGHGTYSPGMQSLLRDRLFARGDGTLIDVGANIGLTSIPVALARRVDCFCFEPDPANYAFLVRNIAANGVEQLVRPYNLALMSAEGAFDFERSADNMGDHRIRRETASPLPPALEGENRREVTRVQARRLDSVLEGGDWKRPLVLKTDTQGADVQVLLGASGLLRHVDFAIAEYSPYLLRRMGDSPEAYFEQLRQFAYGAILDEAGSGPPALVPSGDLVDQLRSSVTPDGTSTDHVDVILSRTPALP